MIVLVYNIYEMKHHKRKRSEFTYREIVRSLMWYYWDYVGEGGVEEQKYYRLYRIANAKFYKKCFNTNQ